MNNLDLDRDLDQTLSETFPPASTRPRGHSVMVDIAKAREVVIDGKVVKSLYADENRNPAASPAPTADPIARQAAVHRSAIARHQQDILRIERVRDITVRTLEAEIAEADHRHRQEVEQRQRRIELETHQAAQGIATRRRMMQSSEAALSVLLAEETSAAPAPKPRRRAR